MRVVIIVLIVISVSIKSYGQNDPFDKMYFAPTITLGFTFGGLFNLGVDFDITTNVSNDPSELRRAGLSFSHYLILMRGGKRPHQVSTASLMFENDQMDLKAGYARINYKWGLRKVNNGGINGFSFDASFTNRESRLPWIGVKSVFYNQSQWPWFDLPYFSPYIKQKFYLTSD